MSQGIFILLKKFREWGDGEMGRLGDWEMGSFY
jgi:hypothetical protein